MNDALRACYEVIQLHSKSFAFAARLLPPDVRDRAVAVYAWCRRADDAIGEEDPVQVRELPHRERVARRQFHEIVWVE